MTKEQRRFENGMAQLGSHDVAYIPEFYSGSPKNADPEPAERTLLPMVGERPGNGTLFCRKKCQFDSCVGEDNCMLLGSTARQG